MTDTTCHQCRQPIAPGDAFCESCGAALSSNPGAGDTPAEDTTGPMTAPTTAPTPPATTFSPAPGAEDACRACGGGVLDDGFCSVCGTRALSPRDHWQESPVDWIGGVCDKGVVHARNEDAMALAGLPDRSLAVLVVCDGVTSAPDSDRAALAAAREACTTLTTAGPPSGDGVAAKVSHWSAVITAACNEANGAAVGVARALGNPSEPPSCTFVAAVADRIGGDYVITVGWCGDSRAYWLPDDGEPVQLMTDHSLGTELIRSGMSRADAEKDSTFHTITRWLGADSVDATPEIASHEVRQPGWLLVCSDGLWNYASLPVAVRSLLGDVVAAGHTTPVAIADQLVRWANDQGGHDNITAALARLEPSLP